VREIGEVEPVRVFDTAVAALAFLAASVALRKSRRLSGASAGRLMV
jgi:hypothetical protein